MHARTALPAVLLALAAATAGCGTDSADDKPSTPATSAAASTPAVNDAAAIQACVDAVQAAVDAGTDDTKPDECASLTESDYLDAYMDGLEQHNQDGRDDLQDAIDEASEAAQP